MIDNQELLTAINSYVRKVIAKVELYNGSALVDTFYYTDALKSFTIERVGEEKFFGFGICQKINIKLVDLRRKIDVSTANHFKVFLGNDSTYISTLPLFYVSEVHRNENTNELSITAYDAIYKASAHTVAELGLESYTIEEFATACAALLGVSMQIVGVSDTETCFATSYESGANFDGTETIREALTAVAGATQTIYYMDSEETLIFKRLDMNGEPVATIDKNIYITLESGTNRRLAKIMHATELGDNVSAELEVSGSTQYIRDNPFWDLREDIATLVDNALAAVGGLTINQFSCEWRGNYLLEVGDKISLTTKDNSLVTSYLQTSRKN